MRSFFITALCLSFFSISYARVAHSFNDVAVRDAQPEAKPEKLAAVKKWFGRLLRRDLSTRDLVPRQDNGSCYDDVYFDFVSELDEDFCQLYMEYPNITETVDYTSTR